MMPVLRPARAPRRTRSLLAVLLLVAFGVLTGCENPDFEQREALPMVEVTYDEAIQMSEREVPHTDFVSVNLQRSDSVHPEWHTIVADQKDVSSLVRVSASSEQVLSSGAPPADEAPDAKELDLVKRITVVPAQAVKKVTKPKFGKVTAVYPDTLHGKPVWKIVVATVEGDHRFAYAVDGTTGEILDRSAVGPGDATLPTPARP